MLNKLFRFISASISDSMGLAKCCGISISLRWLFCIAANFGKCVKQSNFQPADIAMGEGPFQVRRRHAQAKLTGNQVVSGIREIWVRDVYLKDDFLSIPAKATVVDFGANMGNFSMLALAHGQNVRVVGVEPCRSLVHKIEKQIEVNDWSDRMTIHRGFIGGHGEEQEMLMSDADCDGATFCSVQEFLEQHKLTEIDFLKCDIEGSEFDLLTPESPLLAISKQIAIEIHYDSGDRDQLLSIFKQAGFEIGPIKYDPECCIALARKPS